MTTREKILDVVLLLATEKGLSGISLSQIAKEVGIQKQSLYNHFASKADLIDALYEYLRNKAKSNITEDVIDYGEFVKGKQPLEVLTQVVSNYRNMNQDSDMSKFYKFILSERSINSEAAKIMVTETEKMIRTTKKLFYAMQVQHVMAFENVDMAAFSFAMTIHAIIDYIGDQKTAQKDINSEELLRSYLNDFCLKYNNMDNCI